jgi:hypothetical protein
MPDFSLSVFAPRMHLPNPIFAERYLLILEGKVSAREEPSCWLASQFPWSPAAWFNQPP